MSLLSARTLGRSPQMPPAAPFNSHFGSFGRQSARGRGTEVVLGANSRKCLIPGEPEMAQYGGKAV
jgi:hypothetical protein